jgi:hypothetical protein
MLVVDDGETERERLSRLLRSRDLLLRIVSSTMRERDASPRGAFKLRGNLERDALLDAVGLIDALCVDYGAEPLGGGCRCSKCSRERLH